MGFFLRLFDKQSIKKYKRQLAFSGRSWLVATNRYLPLYLLNLKIYDLLEKIVLYYFSRIPGIAAIYLAHGRSLGETFPGLSDFDLVLILEPRKDLQVVNQIRQRWNQLRQLLPVRDVGLMTRQDFADWQSSGGGMDPLEELPHWKLLFGAELRQAELPLGSFVVRRDRLRFVFSNYYLLLRNAIKDEIGPEFLTTQLRRQLYKSFYATVVPIYPELLALGSQPERLRRWGEIEGESKIVEQLLRIRSSRFFRGEVTRLSFELAAIAYEKLNHTASREKSLAVKEATAPLAELMPTFNHQEIKARAGRFVRSLNTRFSEMISAVRIVSNGSPRGYQLHIVLRDQLTRDQLVDFFRHLHEVFRIHDDPWFNEHYPAAVPLVCSESIWQKNLELWDNYQHYWNYHPGQLLGQDPPVVGAPATTTLTEGDQRMIVDGERAAISRFAHQVLMERSRPALFDLLTLYLPRFFLRRSFNACPSSNEEAIAWYQKFFPTEQTSISTKIFAKYRLKDIDALLREVPIELFDEVAPRLLSLISDPPESSELEKLSA